MSKKILHSHFFYPLLLILICSFLIFKNYTPGTFLTGWDTLHPEFNFNVNFHRLIFGVWRYDQGLGDISGHSHMADLPRVIILWLFHFVLPLNTLRYAYVFLCLIIGPLGFYFLIKHLFHSRHLAFLSALVYLLNFGTIQQFYVPFEMFPTQWAYLPLIVLFTFRYLKHPTKISLLLFGLTTLLSAPQAYAAHLWYPFFGLYTLWLLLYSLLHKIHFKFSLFLILTTILLNSFWLLPNLYFAATGSQIPKNNKSNRLHSQEFLLHNRETGVIRDSSLIKGFYFNWDVYNFQTKSSEPLMSAWRQHISNLDIELIGNILFILSFIGLVAAFFNRQPTLISLSPFFIVPFVLLNNRTPVFDYFFNFLLRFNLLQEILRFIFTKISIIYTFAFSLYFAYFLHLLFSVFSSIRFKTYVSLILIISLFIYCYPAFQGFLISPKVRINIPQSYFDLWQYLRSSPDSRILTLPLQEPSGWQYYSWGYQGSGLIWFASPQAFLDRDSDRWSQQNEEAYREFYYALYANNYDNFSRSLTKYNVGYILRDLSIIPTSPKNRDQISFRYETDALLQQLISQNQIRLVNTFDSIELYQLYPKPLVSQLQTSRFIGPSFNLGYGDYQYNQDYLTTNSPSDQQFPYRQLLDSTDRISASTVNQLNLLSLGSTEYQLANLITPPNPNITIQNHQVNIKSLNSTQGISYTLEGFPHSQSFILAVKSIYLQGLPLRLCLKNTYSNLCTFEDELTRHSTPDWDYFLIPPMDSFDTYQIHLNVISYGHQPSSTSLETIKIIPVAYTDLLRLSPTIVPDTVNQEKSVDLKAIFPNYSLISVPIDSNPLPYLTLRQSYHPGWLALYFDHNRPILLPNHYLLNNWANAWELPSNIQKLSSTIYLLFWPQLLELFGFLLIPLAFILIISINLKHK